MYSDGQLSPVGESSVPVPNRMLRRLKKATSISDLLPGSKTTGPEEAEGEDLRNPGKQSAKSFDGLEEEDELRSNIQGLGVDNEITARKALDFDSVPEFNPEVEDLSEKGEDETSDLEPKGDISAPETEDAGEERLVLETSVPEFDPALGGLGDKGEDEISDLETRDGIKVSDEASAPEFDSAIGDLGEKGEDGISDLETREGTKVSDETSVPEFDSELEELDDKSEDETSDLESGEDAMVSESNKARKKRTVLETSDSEGNETKRNKKIKKKSVDFDELPISTASMNMTKKERREYLDQLRAENQRLLRETRDAAFEPVPLVRKPISSVLEKIRRRKEELSKQFLSRNKSNSIDQCDSHLKGDKNGSEEVVDEEINEDMDLEFTSKQNPGEDDCLEESEPPSTKKAESIQTHKDLSSPSQRTNSGEELVKKTSSRSFEEVMTPSVVAMNLKLNPSPPPDKTVQEAEFAKENSDAETEDSSPGDPVRKFIDEDAVEEDDSDNDLLRFEDEEEDEEEDDDLKDMIVSQFKEDPNDKDRRNELHQKWVEQQDAAGTEKLLQKLKRGLQQDETSLFEEEEDEDANDDRGEEAENVVANEDEDEDEEEEEDPAHAHSMRMNIKKIKEMIPLMFTDEDDVYVSSDDEEMEKKLLQQRMFKKMEQKNKFSSSAVDKNNEEILRHIKKPEIHKKAKPSSFKDRTLMGINKHSAASKSSFLGRITKNSTSEGSRKRGSNVVRGYIFERDESNSKSSNSAPEEPEPSVPETIIQEKRRRVPAKFTASQSQATTVEKETSSKQGATLYEILKMSSKKTVFTSGETVISSNQTESIFAAFKLDKKVVKTNT